MKLSIGRFLTGKRKDFFTLCMVWDSLLEEVVPLLQWMTPLTSNILYLKVARTILNEQMLLLIAVCSIAYDGICVVFLLWPLLVKEG